MPAGFIAGGLFIVYDVVMEQILKRLEQIGIDPDVIAAIRDTNAVENALILIMDDDRHEYVD